MQLSFQEIVLLSAVVNLSGELEPQKQQDGSMKEVFSLRKLNGQESSQRKHFFNNTKEFIDQIHKGGQEAQVKLDELKKIKIEDYDKENELVIGESLTPEENTVKKKEYSQARTLYVEGNKELIELTKQLNKEYLASINEEKEIKVEKETKNFLKKCFTEWGDKVGFVRTEDDIVETLTAKLND